MTQDVEAALDELRPGLAGIEVDTTVYRPATFIDTMVDNLDHALLLGAVLLLLGARRASCSSWRAALVSLVAIAASVAVDGARAVLVRGTAQHDVVAGLVMALAIVVDDAVVGVDGVRRRLRQRREEALRRPRSTDAIRRGHPASCAARCFVAAVIAAVSVVPVFVLDGVQRRVPHAGRAGFLVATAVSLVVALTVAPVLATCCCPGRRCGHRESPLARALGAGVRRAAGPAARAAARRPTRPSACSWWRRWPRCRSSARGRCPRRFRSGTC